jgi:pimeloyl-ACP methyl ester carboxylesterase
MPFVRNRRMKIHYTVEGAGPLVVLQHGLFLDAASWRRIGLIDTLAGTYRVACVDSLGHGFSDKPSDSAFYDQEQRSNDIVAVIDDLGYEQAHLVGHSMGGWLGVGVAKYHPNRLSSLVVGGWHPTRGLPPGPKGPLVFDSFLPFAKRTAPKLVEWVKPEFEMGLRACFDSLSQLEGAQEALTGASFPVMIWDGQSDPHHDAKQSFAIDNGFRFLSTPGDHLGMLGMSESAQGVRMFLDESTCT